MYMAEYAAQSNVSGGSAPAMMNAVGACAGFAAQIAVWRELILPKNRNPGDFLIYLTTQTGEVLLLGEAINQYLVSTGNDRVSFLSLGAGTLTSASQLPDLGEIFRHVVQSMGSDGFGRPRLPPSIELPDLPRAALDRTWRKAAQILKDSRPAEWPALFGATAYVIIDANRKTLAPPNAVKILLEAAIPMSKLNPATVAGSGIPAPSFANWSNRAARAESDRDIVVETRAAMPATPARISAPPLVISEPKIVFLNLAGARYATIAAEDQAAFGGLFDGHAEAANASVPTCDVLFLYADIEPSGKIVGQPWLVREAIRDSGAKIAVIASPVPKEIMSGQQWAIQKSAFARESYPAVDLVITLDRNGENFARFFKSIFQMMRTGQSMPMAWVQLAPQGPVQPKDIPGTVFLMEAGQVWFAKR
jgi:hypothetical protein